MGSKSLSLPSKPDEPVFLDLKNFLGLATSEPEDNIEADLIDVKDADPHFPTTPADFEAETPRKENEKKLVKTWRQFLCNNFIFKTSKTPFSYNQACLQQLQLILKLELLKNVKKPR